MSPLIMGDSFFADSLHGFVKDIGSPGSRADQGKGPVFPEKDGIVIDALLWGGFSQNGDPRRVGIVILIQAANVEADEVPLFHAIS
jgi:hypothetical protein